MKVYGFREQETGIMEIGEDLEVYREFVGGGLEAYCMGKGLYIILNKDGRLEELEPRVAHVDEGLTRQIITGDCFVCRFNENGLSASIKEEDITYISEKLIAIRNYIG